MAPLEQAMLPAANTSYNSHLPIKQVQKPRQ